MPVPEVKVFENISGKFHAYPNKIYLDMGVEAEESVVQNELKLKL